MTDVSEQSVADNAFPPSALDGVVGKVEPIVRRAADDFYERVMETVQDYLIDNAEFNIASKIKAANNQAAHDREIARCLRLDNERLYLALRGLETSGILGTAESNASGMPNWGHVSKYVNAARGALDKAAAA